MKTFEIGGTSISLALFVDVTNSKTFVAVGVDPKIIGIGPAIAIPAAVKVAGLELGDIDLLEINELELDPKKINVKKKVIVHWYGYVMPEDVPLLLEQHIEKGEIVDYLWRKIV